MTDTLFPIHSTPAELPAARRFQLLTRLSTELGTECFDGREIHEPQKLYEKLFFDPLVVPKCSTIDIVIQLEDAFAFLEKYSRENKADAKTWVVAKSHIQSFTRFVWCILNGHGRTTGDVHAPLSLLREYLEHNKGDVTVLNRLENYLRCIADHRSSVYLAAVETLDRLCPLYETGPFHHSGYKGMAAEWDCPWARLAFMDLPICDHKRVRDDIELIFNYATNGVDVVPVIEDYYASVRSQHAMAARMLGDFELTDLPTVEETGLSDCRGCTWAKKNKKKKEEEEVNTTV